MSLLEALLYGAVQGITEYLPISSSAHLILLPKFLRAQDPGLTFDVFLHLGTFLATMIYFWRDWLQIFAQFRRPLAPAPAGTLSWRLIAIATIPALIAGAALHHWVETVFRGNAVMMVTLPLGGVLLYAADRFCRRDRALSSARVKDAVIVGLFQCLALVPGMSRSGSTMTGGRFLGLDRTSAARFSFLISAPITGAAIVFELRKWDELVNGSVGLGPLLVAGFASFAFGMLAIGALLRLLRRFGYLSFAMYRAALAVVIFFVLGA